MQMPQVLSANGRSRLASVKLSQLRSSVYKAATCSSPDCMPSKVTMLSKQSGPAVNFLPAMPQPHGTSGRLCLGPARHDQKWLADGRVSRAEDGTARGAHTASGNCRWQGKQITKSAHTPAASNGALSSAPRAGPLFQAESAGRVSAGLVAAARESADKLPLRMRADGGRKRRKRSQ